MRNRLTVGAFSISKQIGEGGMGTVWLGTHPPSGRPVAIKVTARADEAIDEMMQEVRAVARLRHRHIIDVIDAGRVTDAATAEELGCPVGAPWLAMELANRGSVGDRADPILDWPTLRNVLSHVLSGLAYAHAHGVIHRDLKPGNVLVCGPRNDTRFVISDFGIAHMANEDIERASRTSRSRRRNRFASAGTPGFMAPEQIEGAIASIGPATDLYAVACIAWELSTGTPVFPAHTMMRTLSRHLLDPVPEFLPRAPMPKGLEGWLRIALSKEPLSRFETAADSLTALPSPSAELFGEHRAGDVTRFSSVTAVVPLADAAGQSSDRAAISEGVPIRGLLASPITVQAHAETRVHASAGNPVGHLPSIVENDLVSGATRAIDSEDLPAVTTLSTISEVVDIDWIPYSDWAVNERALIDERRVVGAGEGLVGARRLPLIGRHEERRRLIESLRLVRQTNAVQVVLVQGAAGVGKSELVRWFLERAHELGLAHPMIAYHSELSSASDGLPAMLARDLSCVGLSQKEVVTNLDRNLAARMAASSQEARAFLRGSLARVLDSLAGRDERPDHPTLHELTGAAESWIRLRASRRPVILWFDDLHWAYDSLHLTRLLLDGVAAPILIVGTIGTRRALDRALEWDAIRDILDDSRARLLTLAPLDPFSLDELVDCILDVDKSLRGKLMAAGGGPLLLTQHIADLSERELLRSTEDGFRLVRDVQLSTSIADVWRRRLERRDLPEEALEGLEIAAALGRVIDGREWSLACGDLSVPDAILQRLDSDGLIGVDGDGSWGFSHNFMRDALIERARGRGAWANHNQRVALALEELYPGQSPRAAWRQSRHWLLAGQSTAAAESVAEAAYGLLQAGDHPRADAALDELESLLEAGDVDPGSEIALTTLFRRATLHLIRGELAEARHYAETLRSNAHPESPGFEALALGNQARAALREGRREEALELARQAVSLSHNDPERRARVLVDLADVCWRQGRIDEMLSALIESEELDRAAGNRYAVAWSMRSRANAHFQRGDLDVAEELYEDARKMFEELGVRIPLLGCLSGLAEVARCRGIFEEAARNYRVAATGFSPGSAARAAMQINLGLVEIGRDRPSDSAMWFQRAFETATAAKDKIMLCFAEIGVLATASLVDRRWDARWDDVTERIASMGLTDRDLASIYAYGSRLRARCDDSQRAEQFQRLADEQHERLARV